MKAALFHQCRDTSKIQIDKVPEPQLNTGREAITNISFLFWNEQTLIGSTMESLNEFR